VFWSGPQPFATKFPLLPLQVFADAMCNVVQEFPLSTKKGTFPRGRLQVFIVDLDAADLGTPDRWKGMGTAEVFDPSGGIFWVLPSRRDCIQYPPEYHLRSLLAAGKSRRHVIDTPEFFGSLSQGPELFVLV
jgi:hypothetical protein